MSPTKLEQSPLADRGLTALSTRRPVGVTMVALAIVLFGLISFGRLPRNLMPDISYPSVTVRTAYPGAAPIDVEARVSRRLEEVLSQVRNLRRISSISRAEASDVVLEFAWDTEMSLATTEVREKVSQTYLPDGVEAPTFLRYDPMLDPILQIGLYRTDARRAHDPDDLIRLRILAEDELEQALESTPGVAGARVRGGLEKEMRLDVDEERLREKNISIALVSQRIREENLNQASGILYEGDRSRSVRTVNEFQDLEEVRDTILRWEEGVPIRLREVASVSFGFKDPEVITQINGNPCVKIDIYKEADANIVEVAQRVRDRLFGTAEERARLERMRAEDRRGPPPAAASKKEEEGGEKKAGGSGDSKGAPAGAGRREPRPDFLALRLPADVALEVMSDQSVFIRNALDDVRRTVLTGGTLAIAVLYLFLRSAWFTLAVGLSIPLSVMAAFIAMYLFDVSLNMMSLGGLALGIGMLVDNSVVVLESIFRCREEGDAPREAAVRGTSIVASAVTASTLTTVAVFFPIVFVEGVAGQVFRDQALTVVISLLASLVVALYFIPAVVCRRLGSGRAPGSGSEEVALAFRFLARPGRFRAWNEFAGSWRASRWRAWNAVYLAVWLVGLLLPIALLRFLLELLSFAALWSFAGLLRVLKRLWRLGSPLRTLARGRFFRAFDRLHARAHDVYVRLLRVCLDHRAIAAAAVVAVAFLSFRLLGDISKELIPEVHQGEFTVDIRLPRSTRIEETARVVLPWADRLLSSADFEGIASVTTTIGVESDELTSGDEGEHTAKLLVRLDSTGDLRAVEDEVKGRIRELFQGAEFEPPEIVNPVLFSFKTPIEVEVSGYDLVELKRLVFEIRDRMEEIYEIKDVKTNLARGNPEVQVRLDRDFLSRYGLGTGQVGAVIRSKIQGELASYYSLGDRKIPMRVRLREADRDSLEELKDLVVHRDEKVNLRLEDVVREGELRKALSSNVSLVIGEGPAEIRRIAHQRAGVITANLAGMSLGRATERIEEVLQEVDHPPEFSAGFGGQKEEMDRALASLERALILAVFLVYAVMAMQFESLIQPLIIIVSIPLALVGVIPVLYMLEIPLNIVVFIGMIVLAGIVVNNAIVLMDAANRLRRGGTPVRDALIRAGELRLRPILMTTATTVLGLLPLTGILGAIGWLQPLLGTGQGEEIRAPLAITVVAGLITSTLLTLVVIPVIASLVFSGISFLKSWLRFRPALPSPDGGEHGA